MKSICWMILFKVIELFYAKIFKKKMNFLVTLAFIDPFGYSEIPFELIKKFMQNSKCELLLTFMTQPIIRFLATTPEDHN